MTTLEIKELVDSLLKATTANDKKTATQAAGTLAVMALSSLQQIADAQESIAESLESIAESLKRATSE